jgi:RNA polymerase sigma-70 factor (ECF subfamily)
MAAEITELLQRVRDGDQEASGELMTLVYGGLRRNAATHLRRERQGHTLQPTALVDEAYLKLFRHTRPQFADRAHFMAIASHTMRRVLVDYARARMTARRRSQHALGGSFTVEALHGGRCELADVLDLDMAIEALGRENRQVAEAIGMHYFGGMTAAETAEATGRTIHAVQHHLRFGHAWLRRKLAGRAAAQYEKP